MSWPQRALAPWTCRRAFLLLVLAVVGSLDIRARPQGPPLITTGYLVNTFTVRAEDLELTLADGSVFPIEGGAGVIALVLIGRGTMRFSPSPESEKTQVRLFAGAATIDTRFDSAFVWLGSLDAHVDLSRLTMRRDDAPDRSRAEEIVRQQRRLQAGGVDQDLSRLPPLPNAADIVAEVQTRRYGTLTYLRSESAPENITLFERATQKTIALYSSQDRPANAGRTFSEDAAAEYDDLDHDLVFSFAPDRRWIEAHADMRLRVRAASLSALALRLDGAFSISRITSPELGTLAFTRAGRDSLFVALPRALARDTGLTIHVDYSGRIDPPLPEWEMPKGADGSPSSSVVFEPAYLNSTFPAWYPRPPIIDYATGTMQITVPAQYDCLASGELATGSPSIRADGVPAQQQKTFLFSARLPLRHLAFLVTPLALVNRQTITLPGGSNLTAGMVALTVYAHPRVAASADNGARDFAASVANIVRFYHSIVGEVPFPVLSAALLDGQVPGGHTVGYFSAVGWPPRNAARTWRNDPAAFDLFPEFVTAHEVAHQWWGQAVGWNNYHDQWTTEAFTQYFAAIYLAHQEGDEAFRGSLRRMRTFALAQSSQGPLSLGARLGTIRGDSTVFRALLYDKGPAVLHMLRRFIGDDAFFQGIRRFYRDGRFAKPGTDDLRRAMETESGRPLDRFFEQWVYGSSLPQLKFSYRVETDPAGRRQAHFRIDQVGDLFDVPVTVLLEYADKTTAEVVIPVSERSTRRSVQLEGALRRAALSGDDGTLAKW